MNFLNRIFQGVKQKTVGFISSTLTMPGFEHWYDIINLHAFRDSLYLFIGVSMIRETVSSIPLELYRIKGTEGEVEEIHDDPMLDLLHRPNDRQTQREFWMLSIAYYLLAGEAFWYLEREGVDSFPTAMANMRPDHVEVLFSPDRKQVVGYEFRSGNGEVIKILADDVLHIKNIDPINPARGIGVVRPATKRIITEKEVAEYQAATFKSRGRPDIAVFTELDTPTEEQLEEARGKWDKTYGRPESSRAGFFGSNVKDIKLLTSTTPKEMDGITSMNFLRDDILAALRIPKAMITSDDVNLANSKTARSNYYKEACEPVLDAFIDVWNNRFASQVAEDRFLTYESQVNEDRELLLKESVELKKAGIITVNEARALMNYDEVIDGDIREQGSMGTFQLSMKRARLKKKAVAVLKRRPTLYRKFKAVRAVANMIEKEKALNTLKRGRSSVFHSKEMRTQYAKAFNEKIDNKAIGFKNAVDVYNNDLLQRIIKQQEEFGLNPQNVFDVTTEIVAAKKIFVPMMKEMYERTGRETMEFIANGFTEKAAEQFFTSATMLRLLEDRAEFFILSMLDTDFRQLSALIVAGMEEGKGVDAIGREMRQYFDDMSVSRARTIARTETGRLVSEATQEAYKQSDVVTGKEWLTAGDSEVRDEHQMNEADGVIAVEAAFSNGEHYPGEASINCRCALAPAV